MASVSSNRFPSMEQLLHSLDVAKIFSTYEFDDEQSMFFNTAYNNNNGKMSFYCYSFQPQTSGDTILAESLSLSIAFRLADIAVMVTKSKGGLFGSSTWTEVRYVKPALKLVDFVNALSITIAPLLDTNLGIQAPNGIQTQLITMSKNVPDTIPSDDKRRTIYDPIKKASVVITDEEVLKRMPGRWEYVTSKQVEAQMTSETMNANELYTQWAYEQ